MKKRAAENVGPHIQLGRRIKSWRGMAGYDSATDLSRVLLDRYGMVVSKSAIYNWESGNGEAPPSFLAALLELFNPPTGAQFFMEPALAGVAILSPVTRPGSSVGRASV